MLSALSYSGPWKGHRCGWDQASTVLQGLFGFDGWGSLTKWESRVGREISQCVWTSVSTFLTAWFDRAICWWLLCQTDNQWQTEIFWRFWKPVLPWALSSAWCPPTWQSSLVTFSKLLEMVSLSYSCSLLFSSPFPLPSLSALPPTFYETLLYYPARVPSVSFWNLGWEMWQKINSCFGI